MIGHIKSGQYLKNYCPGNIKKILPSPQSAWNTRFYFGHQKLCMDNNQYYYEWYGYWGTFQQGQPLALSNALTMSMPSLDVS